LNESDKVLSYRPIRNSTQLSPEHVDYRSRLPGADLAAHVIEFWQHEIRPPHAYVAGQAFPSGCVTLRFDITHARVDALVYGPSLWAHNLGAFFAGVTSFGVRLRLGAARSLFRTDLDEIRERRIAQRFVWRDGLAELSDRLYASRDFEERVDVVSRFLRKRIGGERPDGALAALLVRLGDRHSVAELARRAGMSERSFHRRCVRETGLGPKELARVMRVQHAMRNLVEKRERNLAATALTANFSDQAHLSRQFQRTLGMSPRSFREAVGRFGSVLATELGPQARVDRAAPPDDWSWRTMQEKMRTVAGAEPKTSNPGELFRQHLVTTASFVLWKARYDARADRVLHL
jgi:AraC-like DNA-binding protein